MKKCLFTCAPLPEKLWHSRSPTCVAVVPDGCTEALLVAVKLKRNEPFVFQSLPSDDVDWRLVLPGTVAIAVVPLLRHWEKRDKPRRWVRVEGYWLTRPDTEQTLYLSEHLTRACLGPLSPGCWTFIAPMDKVHLPGFLTNQVASGLLPGKTCPVLQVWLELICFSSSRLQLSSRHQHAQQQSYLHKTRDCTFISWFYLSAGHVYLVQTDN